MTNSYEQQKNKLKTINSPLMSHHPSSLLPFKAKLPERAVHVVAPDFLISQPPCNVLQLASILLAVFSSQTCQWPHFAKSKGHFSFLIFLDFSGASQSLLHSFWNTFSCSLFPCCHNLDAMVSQARFFSLFTCSLQWISPSHRLSVTCLHQRHPSLCFWSTSLPRNPDSYI